MGKHSAKDMSRSEARIRRRALKSRSREEKRVSEGKPPRTRKAKAKKRWLIVAFIIGVIIGGLLGFYAKPLLKSVAKVYLSFKQKQWQPQGRDREETEEALTTISPDPTKSINTLIIGSDKGSNKGETGWCRSDTMMLVCFLEKEKRAVVISIPRDSRVTIPGHGTKKINYAHSVGGPSLAIETVSQVLDIDVHHYADLNFEGFEKIVDAIGGAPIHLAKPIKDPHAGYLPAGDLLLDGEQALVLVRSRNLPRGDLDRIGSQQAFLKALIYQAEKMGNVWKAKQLLDIAAANLEMDYTADELLTLVEELRGLSLDDAQFVTAPGVPKNIGGGSYVILDETMLARIMQSVKDDTRIEPELLAELDKKFGEKEGGWIQPLRSPLEDYITVLDGIGEPSEATILAAELNLLGHQQVQEGKAKKWQEDTVIYHRREAKERCEDIQQVIPELREAKLEKDDEVTGKYNSPVVIVLGKDYDGPNMATIWGRLITPALDFGGLGLRVKSFS